MDCDSVFVDKGTIYIFPESACLLATNQLGSLVLVEQFRKPRAEYTLEIPGGVVLPNEKPAATAIREFEEETGLKPTGCRFILTLDLDLSTTLHRTHIFSADASEPSPNFAAEFKVHYLPPADALRMVHEGSITHAPTVAAVLAKALDTKIGATSD
ncbi:NUDIX hydrolase [Methylobacterium sp. Leaf111]|uniref:NUDIX hydrolase n=1 Tax=Methylobacterium sp. Leaf111 TaxID=1736257 RepID=UPI0009EACC9D|nr:NUDIX hydrolase [Methylobacterium sp. Leaf111]